MPGFVDKCQKKTDRKKYILPWKEEHFKVDLKICTMDFCYRKTDFSWQDYPLFLSGGVSGKSPQVTGALNCHGLSDKPLSDSYFCRVSSGKYDTHALPKAAGLIT